MASRTDIAGAAVFAAFVATATMVLSVFVAATGGFFNVGEIMVYTAALLMGPYVGAFAGGVGSMLADVALGYTQFAPGTLVIKGVEGFIVGYLGRLALKGFSRQVWSAIAVLVAVAAAGIIAFVGTGYYSGELEMSLGLPMIGQTTTVLYVAPEFWLGLAVMAFILIVAAGFYVDQKIGWLVLAVMAGGSEMVIGYFLYETLVLGSIAAIVEVPFNIAQASVGLLVSIPLVRSIRRIMPQKASSS